MSKRAIAEVAINNSNVVCATDEGRRELARRRSRRSEHQEAKSDDRPLRGAAYYRYSSLNQSDKSVEDQSRECRSFAPTKNAEIIPACEFSDEAVSGTKLHRNGLTQLLEAAERHEFDVLFFHSLSRLARESVISMPILKRLVLRYRIRVISVTEPVDSSNPGWETAAGFLCLMHENQIKELRANVHRGQVGTILARFSVGDIRFGYTSVPSPGGEHSGRGRNLKPRMIYKIDEDQARWVRQIYKWFTQDRQPIDWIVRELNRLQIPKGARAQKPTWKRHNVIGILRSPKYIGLWTWGLMENCRDPSTGVVFQEERPKEESDAWLRDFPELRLVDDETYITARQILDDNEQRCHEFRDTKGQLRGSNGTSGRKHLLSNLMQCGRCQKIMHIGGTHGRYLLCPGARDGTCESRTQLPKARAEKMILEVIGNRIEGNDRWTDAVFKALQDHWEDELASRPDKERELKSAIEDCGRKVQRLVDQIEDSDKSDPDIKDRLRQRRVEIARLESELKQIQARPVSLQQSPTRDWAKVVLKELHDVIRSGTPAGVKALRDLLCGTIIVDEVPVPDKKRKFYLGTFAVQTGCIAAASIAAPKPLAATKADEEYMTEEVRLEFRDVSRATELMARAWDLYQQGKMLVEIARELGVGKSKMTAIIREAARERGETIPDGRERRSSLARKNVDCSAADQLMADIKRLYDQNLPNQEIAKRLGICRDTVTRFLQKWHRDRGLTMIDGRTRYAEWLKSQDGRQAKD